MKMPASAPWHSLLVNSLFALVSTTSVAFSQSSVGTVQHGTIAIVTFRSHRLIAAVDSAIVDASDNKRAELGCKIVALGDRGLFLIVGIQGVTGDFTSTELAQKAFHTPGAVTTSAGTAGVPHKWGVLITRHLNHSKFHVLSEAQAAGTKTIGFFGFEDSVGGTHLYTVELAINGQGKDARATFEVEEKSELNKQYGTARYISLMVEEHANSSMRAHLIKRPTRSNTSERDLEPLSIAAVLDAVIQWSPGATDIAGPIDVAVLESGSPVRWVRRKPTCCGKDH